MVLNHVANHTRLLVQLAPAAHAELLGHRDLHVLDVATVPDRIEERICEPEVQDVLDGLFPKIVVDSKNGTLGKRLEQQLIQRAGRLEAPAERFLDDDAGVVAAACTGQLLHHGREHAGRNREVVRGTRCLLELGSHTAKRLGIAVVTLHIAEL